MAISSTDNSYDGLDLVIRGVTVTIDGVHSFNALQLREGAVLTHSATTAEDEFQVDLTLSGGLLIDETSSINVIGRDICPGIPMEIPPKAAPPGRPKETVQAAVTAALAEAAPPTGRMGTIPTPMNWAAAVVVRVAAAGWSGSRRARPRSTEASGPTAPKGIGAPAAAAVVSVLMWARYRAVV